MIKSLRKYETQSFNDGDVIFSEGEISSEMFVIRTGAVEISKNVGGHAMRLAVLDRGAFFGSIQPGSFSRSWTKAMSSGRGSTLSRYAG